MSALEKLCYIIGYCSMVVSIITPYAPITTNYLLGVGGMLVIGIGLCLRQEKAFHTANTER